MGNEPHFIALWSWGSEPFFLFHHWRLYIYSICFSAASGVPHLRASRSCRCDRLETMTKLYSKTFVLYFNGFVLCHNIHRIHKKLGYFPLFLFLSYFHSYYTILKKLITLTCYDLCIFFKKKLHNGLNNKYISLKTVDRFSAGLEFCLFHELQKKKTSLQ